MEGWVINCNSGKLQGKDQEPLGDKCTLPFSWELLSSQLCSAGLLALGLCGYLH